MIELAPKHKYGLPIPAPVMPAAGIFGYGNAYHDLVDFSTLGALVTNPVSLVPRSAARGRRIAAHHGKSLVVHTGLPNPGLKRVLHEYCQVWERMTIPVIVHLIATKPNKVATAARLLANAPGIAGIELGLAENVETSEALALLAAAQDGGYRPIIVRVPFSRVSALAPALAESGADALTLTGPPRTVIPLTSGEDRVARFMRGRLYSPACYPMMLHQLVAWCKKLEVPIIACGGISTAEQAMACLTLGASAVQIDAVLWRDPQCIERIAHALRTRVEAPEAASET